MPRTKRVTVPCAAAVAVLALLPAAPGAGAAPAPAARPAAATSPISVIPKPATLTRGTGTFRLARSARIVAPSALRSGQQLALYLRPATGYRLPVVRGAARAGDIVLRVARTVPGLPTDSFGEGYRLDVTRSGVTAVAHTSHGLFNAGQTVRQLLPPAIASGHVQRATWTMPAVHVVDHPRYRYRGFMLDIARHYRTPSEVKALLARVTTYKINVLHLHLGDDQGFRVAIDGFPRLTSIGGRGSVGTGGRTRDPGGVWTQAQYRSVVRYAAQRFVTVVPEVDSPGHTNAIIMSEYGDTRNPRLVGNRADINCSTNHPPRWNYGLDVGYSALCPESRNSTRILTAIVRTLTALSPGPYYDLGGDEVPATVLSQRRYAAAVNREVGIVRARHRTVMGWAEIAGAGTRVPRGSVAQYWAPASGRAAGTETARQAVAKGMKLVMSPANHAYLDQKYAKGVPANYGLTWACPNGCDIDLAYNWSPAHHVAGVPASAVLGVEATVFGETTRTLAQVETLVFPRLLATAELGWSQPAVRTATSPAYRDFLRRLGAQGPRFRASGTHYHRSPAVPWR